MSFLLKLIAEVGGAAILPYNGIVNGLARLSIPYNYRLTLIRDTYCGNIFSTDIHLGDSFCRYTRLTRPYFVRIMLDPSRFREDLLEFLLSDRANPTFYQFYLVIADCLSLSFLRKQESRPFQSALCLILSAIFNCNWYSLLITNARDLVVP
jgi:hypothetical protein